MKIEVGGEGGGGEHGPPRPPLPPNAYAPVYQFYSFHRYCIIKGKTTGGKGVKIAPTQITVKEKSEFYTKIFTKWFALSSPNTLFFVRGIDAEFGKRNTNKVIYIYFC